MRDGLSARPTWRPPPGAALLLMRAEPLVMPVAEPVPSFYPHSRWTTRRVRCMKAHPASRGRCQLGRVLERTSHPSQSPVFGITCEASFALGVFLPALRSCRLQCRLPLRGLAGRGVAQRFVERPPLPQREQQHRQPSCDSHDRALLRVPCSCSRVPLTPAAQVAVGPERPEDVVRSLHQQPAQICVAALADAELRRALARVALPRHEPEVRPHLPTLRESAQDPRSSART